jgi:hypothetical protein
MTAEGDNRVLMIKIVKDMMSNIASKKSQLPKMTLCPKNQLPHLMDILQLDILLNLHKYRELTLFRKLTTTLEKRTKQDKANPFEVLMFEVSDLVQSLAQAYGERQALDFCIQQLSDVKCPVAKRNFETLFKLYAAENIVRDLGFYISEGVLSQTAGASVTSSISGLVKDIAKSCGDILDSLNVPTHALHTPIIGDYVKYNEKPHYGEVVDAKL